LLTPLGIALGLLFLGSLMAGVEASLLVLPEARLRALRDELGERGRVLERYLQDPNRTLSRLLAGRVLFPITAATLASTAALRVVGRWWASALVVLALSSLYGMMAEVAVTFARRRARQVAPVALFLFQPFEVLFAPIAAPMALAGRWASARLVGPREPEQPVVTEKEVEYVVEQAQTTGAVDPMSSQLLQNVFGLKDRTAREVMVPRTQMVALEVNTPMHEALQRVGDEGHSRVPVYKGQVDEIVGVLFTKDLYRMVTQRLSRRPGSAEPEPAEALPSELTLARIIKPAFFVSDQQSILSVLRDMQAQRTHLAMVVDEFGAVAGVVTLEDILEELVGEIQDEHDAEDLPFVELDADRWLVSATMAVEDLSERLGVKFPKADDYDSLGGFLGARAGKVPEVGTVVVWHGLRFMVREGDKRRATKVEIRREPRTSVPPLSAAAGS
jgi:CBS domain containing-hemolysin-like protein